MNALLLGLVITNLMGCGSVAPVPGPDAKPENAVPLHLRYRSDVDVPMHVRLLELIGTSSGSASFGYDDDEAPVNLMVSGIRDERTTVTFVKYSLVRLEGAPQPFASLDELTSKHPHHAAQAPLAIKRLNDLLNPGSNARLALGQDGFVMDGAVSHGSSTCVFFAGVDDHGTNAVSLILCDNHDMTQ